MLHIKLLINNYNLYTEANSNCKNNNNCND